MLNRITTVVLAAVVLITGALPAHGYAVPPAIPVAPPIAGFCVTPVGAAVCIGGVAVGVSTGAIPVPGHNAQINTSGLNVVWDWFGAQDQGGVGATEDGWCLISYVEGRICGGGVRVKPNVAAVQELVEQEWGHEVPWGWDTYTPGDPFRDIEMWIPAEPEDWTDMGLEPGFLFIRPCLATETLCSHVGFESNRRPTIGTGMVATAMYRLAEGSPETLCPEYWSDQVPLQEYPEVGSCILVVPAQHGASTSGSFEGAWTNDTVSCGNSSERSINWGVPADYGWTGSSWWRMCRDGPGGSPAPTDYVTWKPNMGGPNELANVQILRWGVTGSRVTTPMVRQDLQEVFTQSETVCQDAAGNTHTFTQSVPGAQLLAGVAGIELPGEVCPAGMIPVSGDYEICLDVAGTVCTRIGGFETPVPELTEPELQCYHQAATPSPCVMWLEHLEGSTWSVCVEEVTCQDWWGDPARDARYRCGWGGMVGASDAIYYPASQCMMLMDYYDGGEVTTQPQPEPPAQPIPGGDPGTIMGPDVPPAARPTQNWWQRIVTEWGTGTTVDLQNSCWPQGWGLLNPLQWVLRPTICALTWAFVPTQPVQARLEELWTTAQTHNGLGQIIAGAELFSEVGGPAVGGSCGWGFSAMNTGLFTIPETDLILCPSDHGLTGTASTARTWGYAVVGLWTAGMVYRWINLGRAEELEVTESTGGNL